MLCFRLDSMRPAAHYLEQRGRFCVPSPPALGLVVCLTKYLTVYMHQLDQRADSLPSSGERFTSSHPREPRRSPQPERTRLC